MKFVKL